MSSVLFINRVYPPLDGATGQLLAELAPVLAKAGWKVTVVTSRGNPLVARSEVVDGVQVERVRGLPFTRASYVRRALSYLSLYPALFWRAAGLPCHDIVVSLTDPPMQMVFGGILARLKKAKHLHWAQDVYPELAEEMGVLKKGGLIASCLRQLSTWALRRAHGVIVVGRCMQERLAARGLNSVVIPNWGQSMVSCHSDLPGECFRRGQGWADRFVVMYSGNFGLAHSFDTILDAAALMRVSQPQALFVFVGDGPRLPWVKQQADQRSLGNVQFLPFQSKEKLTELLASADVHLACMRSELCGLVVPSKVYGIIAAARPCVFLGPADSEAARMVRELDCGTVLSAATGDSLSQCLSGWATDRQRVALVRATLRAVGARVGVEQAVRSIGELFASVSSNRRIESVSGDSVAHESATAPGASQSARPALALPGCRGTGTELIEATEKQDAA